MSCHKSILKAEGLRKRTIPVYREGPGEAEAASEPKPIKNIRGSNKVFFWYRVIKSNFIENMVQLLNGLEERAAKSSRKALY